MRLRSVMLLAIAMTLLAVPVMAVMRKNVSLWVARDIAPGPKVRLTINTRSVPIVHMAAYRIRDVGVLINRESGVRPAAGGAPARNWDVNLVSQAERRKNPAQRDVFRSRQVNLPALTPGVYLLTAQGGEKEAWAIVNITDLAVVVKRSPRRVLTWVTDHGTGGVIKGAEITLYRRIPHTTRDAAGKDKTTYTFEAVKKGVTGKDGASLIDAPPGLDQTVVVERGGDLAAVPCGIPSGDGVLKSHFQTDRPVYRPGQTVYYKAIFRRTSGRGYRPVSDTDCTVQVRDPEDNVVEETKATTNAIGSLSGQCDIPSEGALGPYSIVVSVGNDKAYDTFTVAEYRKPEFKVTVSPVEKRYLAGEELAFAVEAAYYFGAPVPQAAVRYQVRRSSTPYWGDASGRAWWASDDGNLYPRDTYSSQDVVAEGVVHTDDSGRVSITIKTKRDAPDSSYSIACTVQDSSRREASVSGSVPVYAAGLRVGIRTDLVSAPLGSNIPLQVQVVDLDGKPALAKVKLVVEGSVWDSKAEDYKMRTFSETSVNVPASGRAAAKVPGATEGDLVITATATDSTGRKTSTSTSVWVAGAASKVEKTGADRQPTVTVKLDRQVYAPGDTVKSWIGTNTLDRPLLVTAEGRDIWQYEVHQRGRSTYSWKLKTSLEMSPNAYIEVCQWARFGRVGASAAVPIPDATRKLNVQVEPERRAYKPGDKASYLVRTTGQDGRPVSAEVALAVVDESVYAVRPDTTPDLFTTFWAARPNAIVTGSSAPEEISGGAYQRVSATAPIREKFMDTAYWNAHVMTGPDGAATVSLEMPGNLTTWRATARAVTGDTRVGTGTAAVQSSRPVMLRLAAPRQMVQGDRLTLIGTVNNRTAAVHEFETAISAEGVRIEGETSKKVQVPAMSQGTVAWTIFADAIPDGGQASITGRTLAVDTGADEGDEMSDALKVRFRIVPKGVQHRLVEGGAVGQEKMVVLNLPSDRIEPASEVMVMLRAGIREVVDGLVSSVVGWGRCGSLSAADELLAVSIVGAETDPSEAREALAVVYSSQKPDGGWGWWDGPSDPETTAAVLTALARARKQGMVVSERSAERAISAVERLFGEENLWERAALAASAATLAGYKDSSKLLDKVHEMGTSLSPFAQLSLAEAYLAAGKREWAVESAQLALKNAVTGPEEAYVSAGEHFGWSATTPETTAQALLVLTKLLVDDELQPKLARWLVGENTRNWLSQHEKTLAALALSAYANGHPQSAKLGTLKLSVNGAEVTPAEQKGGTVQAVVPHSLLRDGDNTFVLKRDEPGEVFYSVEARVFRPVSEESQGGMRVLRRYEVGNAGGLWDEMQGEIKPSQPVRCTVVVWPDDRPDAIRVVEPIPSGFEYVESDQSGYFGREEVRDGAVVHYLRSSGRPVSFRYYLRSESEGAFAALPAIAEALRRPAVRGNSELTTFAVRE